METITGVFRSRESADQAVSRLHSAGIRQISVLAPGASEKQLHAVPTSDAEQPGMGKAVGGVVGAAIGIAGGLELGAVAAASMLIPGVGPVVAVGLAGAALLGALGAVGGAAAGAALESTNGIPADEVFVYKDALRKGRSVLFAEADGDLAAKARAVLAEAGAETIDAAREEWWIGLSSAELEHYRTLGRDFERDGPAYRKGFEAALAPDSPRRAAEVADKFYASGTDHEAFRSGYERGLTHRPEQY